MNQHADRFYKPAFVLVANFDFQRHSFFLAAIAAEHFLHHIRVSQVRCAKEKKQSYQNSLLID